MESEFNSDYPFRQHQHFPIPALSPSTTTGIYTTLTILRVMRKQLGLEAMLEYMDKYLSVIDKSNPRFKTALRRALRVISVERIYHEAMRTNEE